MSRLSAEELKHLQGDIAVAFGHFGVLQQAAGNFLQHTGKMFEDLGRHAAPGQAMAALGLPHGYLRALELLMSAAHKVGELTELQPPADDDLWELVRGSR